MSSAASHSCILSNEFRGLISNSSTPCVLLCNALSQAASALSRTDGTGGRIRRKRNGNASRDRLTQSLQPPRIQQDGTVATVLFGSSISGMVADSQDMLSQAKSAS
eukprot:CAMPEP_0205857078 /NCGR_PEP_ID=MMETSP1083-20121108/3471_1 /ASSEMBLY_ACC=CAM_ASM_000430 /TAXON_ID=97485 /ORGANISM="Prymnesium parvum, Strain Texoma1" /LENGTH=105 /DNA_ID=CAMNT_0053218545 /DNA_START=80 /DNA_END=400 /DNA_ORIENTATION=+